ncbi:alcohol dehydrogenase [Xaviernesmea oryzae]|uniref:Alcohol dehydrogenase n=1 Tax=Xaviernesmea oryzae TaxID=464029 RepID=A0A1Q9B2U1_9HYPH|nr:NAD(P)-dependent alcohol dehydrogenase [Xaviernesmea oryzae]OLP62326.1 alcohol dehydrogenase [Xaviernesmea oryzae]SEL96895.1 NADPH:quinone reductase [Xaviernesmea oryzae]
MTTPSTSRRWALNALGLENLTLAEAPIRAPEGNTLLVRVEAVSLNYRDKLMIENGMGSPLSFPFIPASDMAGTVIAAGPQAKRFKPGDHVISTFSPDRIEGLAKGNARTPPYQALGGAHPGVLAEHVTFSEEWFVAAPSTFDAAEASTLPCAGLTAWSALIELGRIKAGDRVLIKGTGGVALFGLQLAKAHGAEVFITTSSPEKGERARMLGADHILPREGWVEPLLQASGDHGADHVLELVGGPTLGQSLAALALGGRISVIGVLEGFDVSGSAGPLLLKQATIQGISVGHRRGLEDLVHAVDHLGLKPVIDARYPFEAAHEAFAHLERGPFGKVVITM